MMNLPISKFNIVLSVILIGLILILLAFMFVSPNSPLPLPGSRVEPSGTPPATAALPLIPPTSLLSPTSLFALTPTTPTSLFAGASATATLTPGPIKPPSTNITIMEEVTRKGIYLLLSGGENDVSYRLGPLAKGDYAVGPNDLYLVYVSDSGQVLAIRLGESAFKPITNMSTRFTAILRKTEPSYSFAFYDSGYAVTLIITEHVFDEKIPVTLPREITY